MTRKITLVSMAILVLLCSGFGVIFRKQGDSFRVGRVLYHLAYIPHFAGELENAKSKYQEGSDVYQTINDKWGMGECIHCIAHVEELQGNLEKAYALYSQSLELLKPAGVYFTRWEIPPSLHSIKVN
jgi:hypothetical protein